MSSHQSVVLFEQHYLTNQKKYDPFILTDILADYAGKHQVAIMHFWTMENQLILGMQDTRVEDLPSAIQSITTHGYHPVVRNSGGLAVVADKGILNFSLILPQEFSNQTSINHGYEMMKSIISSALAPFNAKVESFEVTDSYCPGEFDLSINSKKFAGIAQRRIKKGLGIMIYISLNGNQKKRGELVKEFYHAGLKEKFGQESFPPVNPDSMKNLSDLLTHDFSIKEFQQSIIEALSKSFQLEQSAQEAFNLFLESKEFKNAYDKGYSRMKQRNEGINTILKENH